MVERRLPKPKVAGSNPVFRSIKFPRTTDRSTPAAVFFILPPAPERKTTLTDIPNENKIPHLPKVCIFPAMSPHLPKVSFRTMSSRASVAAFCLHSAFPHLPKVSRNTRKSTHLPKVEQQQSHRLRIFRYCPQDFVPLQHYGRQLSRKKIRRIPGAEGRSRESEAEGLEEAAGRLPEANDGR